MGALYLHTQPRLRDAAASPLFDNLEGKITMHYVLNISIIIGTLGLLGFLGMMVYDHRQKQKKAASATTVVTVAPADDNNIKHYGLKLFAACVAIVLIITLVLYVSVDNIALSTVAIRPWLLWLFAGAAYIALSWRFSDPIPPDGRAVRVRLGRATDTMGSGPPFLPLGIFTRIPLTNLVVQRELPGEPHKLYRGEVKTLAEAEEILTKGWVLPLRITFGDAKLDEAGARKRLDYEYDGVEDADGRKIPFNPHVTSDGLAQRLSQEVSLIIRFRIMDGVKFIQNTGDVESAVRQIEDEMVGVVNKRFPLISVSQALQNLGWINAILYRSVIRRTLNWGVEIEPNGAYVKSIGLNHDLNKALTGPAKADFDAKAAIRTSEGQRETLINVGTGTADAAQRLARGEIVGKADGLHYMTGALDVDGADVLAANVATEFAKAGNATFVSPETGVAGLVGIGASIFNRPGSTSSTPPNNGGNTP